MYTPPTLFRRTLSGIAALSMVLSSFVALVPVASAATPNWDTTGSYTVNFNYLGTDYPHNVSLTQDGLGTLSGGGTSGVYAWSIDSGTVDGDLINFTAHYTASDDATTTTMSVTGTVASGGTMSGSWSDNYPGDGSRNGTWATVSGAAVALAPAPTSTPPTATTTSSQTVVVHQADLDAGPTATAATNGSGKWFMYNDNDDTVNNALGSFVTGPATPPIGTGSIEFTLGTTTTRDNIATFKYSGTALSTIANLSYSAYSHSGVAGATESPYLVFNVDFTGSSGAFQKRLVYVPSQNGAVPQDSWNTFDAISGGNALWNYSGTVWPTTAVGPDAGVVGEAGTTLRSWSDILADYPNARLLPVGGFLGIRVGEPGPTNYVADIDNISVGIQTGSNIDTTTYDFEPTAPVVPPSCTPSSTFDDFTLGSVNGQSGWQATGPFDQAVVTNTYGYATFGCQTLRISDAVTSGSFGDQVFSAANANEAGESTASSSGMSGGTRTNHFEAQFDLASAVPGALQPGMHLSVSPDRGDGARMSYLRFEDQTTGIHVFFDDVTDPGPTSTVASFNETDIATLDRTVPHTIKFSMDFVDGPANDVVTISIDGAVVHTGTSWEDYYRYDPEQAANGNVVPTTDSVIFRQNGTANPADSGKGFLIDNFSTVSGAAPATTTPPAVDNGGGGNRRNGSSGSSNNNNGGQVLGAATGPDAVCSTPLFNSFMRIDRQNNTAQVILLQWFLNGEVGSALPLSGVFGTSTEMAVKTFQTKYASDILAPWGLSSPTGWFYKLSQWKSNIISCAGINLPKPAAVIDPGDL